MTTVTLTVTFTVTLRLDPALSRVTSRCKPVLIKARALPDAHPALGPGLIRYSFCGWTGGRAPPGAAGAAEKGGRPLLGSSGRPSGRLTVGKAGRGEIS